MATTSDVPLPVRPMSISEYERYCRDPIPWSVASSRMVAEYIESLVTADPYQVNFVLVGGSFYYQNCYCLLYEVGQKYHL